MEYPDEFFKGLRGLSPEAKEKVREMEAKKAGRRATAIRIRCAKDELWIWLKILAIDGFELDESHRQFETVDCHGTRQHVVVLHDPALYEALVSQDGIEAETR